MRIRALLAIPLFCLALLGQDAALKDSFLQAKALWATQGDRDGATNRFDTLVATLAPQGIGLEPAWFQILCESYNWLAVLDDRSPQSRPRAQVRLQALLDLNPDFELDRVLTSQRLTTLFEQLRSKKYALLKMSFLPEGGRLLLDGKASGLLPRKYLPFGTHRLAYSRAGHAPVELTVELGPNETKSADFKLVRTTSTLTFHVQPSDVEVLLDGKSLGFAIGKAGPEAAALTLPAGMRVEDLSAPFVISDLPPGKHTLELRAPCFRTRIIELGEDLAAPPADHTLEPFRMVPSKGTLSVSSPWPGGELFLSGQSLGPLPAVNVPVCSGSYEVTVRFPAGGFSLPIKLEEGKSINLEARPKPRLAFLGLESGDFTGRARFQAMLESLGERLEQLVVLPPRPDEPPKDALVRLKASREAELVLMARPLPDKLIHRVELIVATLDGEEERRVVKPLEQDPLASLAQRLNAIPRTWQADLGLSLLDVPGEPGPWVLAATELALKAGIVVGKPILQAQGSPLVSVQDLRRLLQTAKDPLSLTQEGATVSLPIQNEAVEIPLGSTDLCYPALLAQLRLQYASTKGDEANLIKLNQALLLMQFRRYDKAIELLRDARLTTTRGVSQGTIDYYTGRCFVLLGASFQSEAGQAFRQALKYPLSTLLDPEGPLVAPLARQSLEELK